MKKSLMFFALVCMLLSEHAFARDNNGCPSNTKRVFMGILGGAGSGAFAGLITDGGKGAAKLATIGAGVGGAAAYITRPNCNSQARSREESPRLSRRNPGTDYRGSVDTADRLAETKGLKPVYVRSFSGGDSRVLQGLLNEALDVNEYRVISASYPPKMDDPDVYFIEVVVTDQSGHQDGNYGSISGPRGYINRSRNNGSGKYYVSIQTSKKASDGRFYIVPGLSRNRIPMTGTYRNGNVNAGTRVGNINLNGGRNTNDWAVNPQTDAAGKAIAEVFNHNF